MGELRTASLTGSKPGIWVACRSDSGPSSAAASEPVETPPVATGQCPPTISFFGLSAPFILKAKARATLYSFPQFLSTPTPSGSVQFRPSVTISHSLRNRLAAVPGASFIYYSSSVLLAAFSARLFRNHLRSASHHFLPQPLSHSGNPRTRLVKYFFHSFIHVFIPFSPVFSHNSLRSSDLLIATLSLYGHASHGNVTQNRASCCLVNVNSSLLSNFLCDCLIHVFILHKHSLRSSDILIVTLSFYEHAIPLAMGT